MFNEFKEMGYEELKIQSYDVQIHRAGVEDLERRCEVGPAERVVLFTDTLGDPICRIRNSPNYKMLVCTIIFILFNLPFCSSLHPFSLLLMMSYRTKNNYKLLLLFFVQC